MSDHSPKPPGQDLCSGAPSGCLDRNRLDKQEEEKKTR